MWVGGLLGVGEGVLLVRQGCAAGEARCVASVSTGECVPLTMVGQWGGVVVPLVSVLLLRVCH